MAVNQFVETAKQVEIDAGDEAVFEFGIGETVPLSEQDGFEYGQQRVGGTAAVVSKVNGFFDDSGTVRSAANQSLDPTSIAGNGRCVWQSWLGRFVERRCSWNIP